MPRVTIEEKVKVADNIFEVKERSFIVPEKILRDGIVFEYDPDIRHYISNTDFITISVENYIRGCLNNANKADESICEEETEETLLRKLNEFKLKQAKENCKKLTREFQTWPPVKKACLPENGINLDSSKKNDY